MADISQQIKNLPNGELNSNIISYSNSKVENNLLNNNMSENNFDQDSDKIPNGVVDDSSKSKLAPDSESKADSEKSGDFVQESQEVVFYKYLANPIFHQLEEIPIKNNEILEEIIRSLHDEKDTTKKRHLSGHIPSVLQGSGKDVKEIIQQMENLIQYENYDPNISDTSNLILSNLLNLDQIGGLSVVGHSLGAYISILESSHLKHMATKIVSDVSLWISRIFKYPEAAVHFHEEEKEGLIKICQLALHKKYPKFSSEGYEVLYVRPPRIYISASAKHNLGQNICYQLGLPLSCLITVPCNLGHMDLIVLNKLIEDDIISNKMPVLVMAYAGTHLLGRCDNLNRLHEICRLHDIWLHLEGSSLSMLPFPNQPSFLMSVSLCNSMTINLSAWLALPAVPFVTLFRSPDIVLTRLVGLSSFNVRYKFNCTSLWMCMQTLQYDQILARLHFHTYLAQTIHEHLSKMKTSNKLIIFPFESPSVVFRYQFKKEGDLNEESNSVFDFDKVSTSSNRDPYCDTLNIWLTDMLKHTVSEIPLSVVEIDGIGMCVRYSPLETSYVNPSSLFEVRLNDLEQFLCSLDQHIQIIDATVEMRLEFADIVDAQDNIQLVSLPTWAGLGAVQYIPDIWLSEVNNLSERAKHEINVLNHQIVQQLKSTDSAFSIGMIESGMYCIRFGLVTKETDLEELISNVLSAGKDSEESSKFLEVMADAVKKGIQKAAEDLEQESQEKLLQEGVLRQVPIVGSFLNWWSPPPKDTIKGRTFNLVSGKVASTEDTYKLNMQLLEKDCSDLSGNFIKSHHHTINLKPTHKIASTNNNNSISDLSNNELLKNTVGQLDSGNQASLSEDDINCKKVDNDELNDLMESVGETPDSINPKKPILQIGSSDGE